MSMTVGDLIQLLETMDEDAEVRLAHQPNYPFDYRVGGVADSAMVAEAKRNRVLEDMTDEGLLGGESALEEDAVEGEIEERLGHDHDVEENIVWITEAGQIGYCSGAIFDAAGDRCW